MTEQTIEQAPIPGSGYLGRLAEYSYGVKYFAEAWAEYAEDVSYRHPAVEAERLFHLTGANPPVKIGDKWFKVEPASADGPARWVEVPRGSLT